MAVPSERSPERRSRLTFYNSASPENELLLTSDLTWSFPGPEAELLPLSSFQLRWF